MVEVLGFFALEEEVMASFFWMKNKFFKRYQPDYSSSIDDELLEYQLPEEEKWLFKF